jgi:hypothetical protein
MEEYTTKTVQFGACTIVIQRPILAQAERDKREKQVQATLSSTLRDYYIRKDRKA